MKVLIAIDAPFNETPDMGGREWQWRRTGLGKLVRLLAEQIERGSNAGALSGDNGVTLHFKVEQSLPAEGEQAA
jgi:hypothetical protein